MTDIEKVKKSIIYWYQARDKILQLNKKSEMAKNYIKKYMITNDLYTISLDDLKVSRKNCKKIMITKKDIPKDIWEKYSKEIKYESYSISKIKSTSHSSKNKRILT